ncbi:GAF domain-containing protein [Geothrix sp. PMB-07]|uniref:GAF domain-containing protein n=1 Tax=Geothrix sp. PMB-07 TaxID=3068640 RepID=UPI002741221C|nr:GAF domain-containing protein [Geothrix sp. PMB-07]WLT32868.1 GAF domain-containing protein [Geothrix sp. PMB-07]
MSLFGARKHEQSLAERDEQLQKLEVDCLALQGRLEETQELVRHLDEDRDLLLSALERLHPGDSAEVLAQTLLEVTFKPMGLACFFLALADWDQDLLQFVLYQEGGRARNHPSRRLSDRAGLSERVLSGRRSIYIRTMEEGHAAGSFLTAAEQATGLIPHSWYGVPLGHGPRPIGVVSFQSFQTDAFSDSRRRVMDALAGLLSTCLEARASAQEP